MLASLITVALLVGANASPSMTKVQTMSNAHHSATSKAVQKITHSEARVAVAANFKAAATSTTGYLKFYVQAESETCTDAGATSYFWQQYGNCLMQQGDDSYQKSTLAEQGTNYNLTTTFFSDADCSIATFHSSQSLPMTCDTAISPYGNAMYVMSTPSKYSQSGFGTQTWNSDGECNKASSANVIEATEMIFGQCYALFGMYATVNSGCNANAVTGYTDSDCTNKIMTDDGYGYGDDDADDAFYSDDDLMVECLHSDDDTAFMLEEYTSFYCTKKSAASSMFAPSAAVAMIAAAVATMI